LLGLLGAIAGALVGTGFGLLMGAARHGWAALGNMGSAFSFGFPVPGWLALIGAMIAVAAGFLIVRWLYVAVAARSSQGPFSPALWGAVGAGGGLALGLVYFGHRLTSVLARVDIGLGLWVSVAVAIGLGAVLAVVAAVYPAQQAAKMPPAAALRVEI
jgi:ABC-type antimicrobial peptide transport system permease subunit